MSRWLQQSSVTVSKTMDNAIRLFRPAYYLDTRVMSVVVANRVLRDFLSPLAAKLLATINVG
jgi:hypothetical protein